MCQILADFLARLGEKEVLRATKLEWSASYSNQEVDTDIYEHEIQKMNFQTLSSLWKTLDNVFEQNIKERSNRDSFVLCCLHAGGFNNVQMSKKNVL